MIDSNKFIDIHKGKTAIVLGLGTSTNDLIKEDLSGFVTIGVNDIGAVYQPRYVLTLDTPSRLDRSMGATLRRAAVVAGTKAEYLFAPDSIREWEAFAELKDRVVGLNLGGRHLRNIDDPSVFDFSSNSPYVAVILAYRMGCTRIGVVGVDFTEDHCHARDGVHELVRNGRLQEINRDYAELTEALNKRGCELYNISGISLVTGMPKMGAREFLKV